MGASEIIISLLQVWAGFWLLIPLFYLFAARIMPVEDADHRLAAHSGKKGVEESPGRNGATVAVMASSPESGAQAAKLFSDFPGVNGAVILYPDTVTPQERAYRGFRCIQVATDNREYHLLMVKLSEICDEDKSEAVLFVDQFSRAETETVVRMLGKLNKGYGAVQSLEIPSEELKFPASVLLRSRLHFSKSVAAMMGSAAYPERSGLMIRAGTLKTLEGGKLRPGDARPLIHKLTGLLVEQGEIIALEEKAVIITKLSLQQSRKRSGSAGVLRYAVRGDSAGLWHAVSRAAPDPVSLFIVSLALLLAGAAFQTEHNHLFGLILLFWGLSILITGRKQGAESQA